MSKRERIAKFETFKREGIKMENIEEIKKDTPQYQVQRKGNKEDMPIMCSNCNMTIQRRSSARHFKTCSTTGKLPFKLDINLLREPDMEFSESFKKHILATLKNDDVGLKAKNDKGILLFASKEFQKTLKNPDKILETRISVRRNLREITKLYMLFLEIGLLKEHFKNVKDMFLIDNFSILRSAIEKYGKYDDGSIKSGAKVNIQYTIINAVKTFIGVSHVSGNLEELQTFERFLSSFKIFENVIFGDARYALEIAKKKRLKLPQELPFEKDMEDFRNYTVDEIKNLDASNFVSIRDATCARLTLFNARR